MKLKKILFPILLFGITFSWTAERVWAAMTVEDFIISPMGSSILIEWWTGNETNNTGFYIQRSQSQTSGFQRITNFFPSEWDGIQSAYYYFFDEEVQPEVIYYYRIEAVDTQGVSSFYGPAPGSTNQMLPTFTASAGASPTQTQTPTVTLSIASITPSPTSPITTSSATTTGTPATPFIPTPSPSLTGSAPAQTLTPTITGTILPSVTTTLEPLPTIVLTFPATETQPPQEKSLVKAPTQTPTPTPVSAAGSLARLPARLVSVGVIVVIIWVCLGAFLVFMVHQFRD